MDEQQAHDSIEEQAETFLQIGFEPTDAEPGEWLLMEHPDGRVVDVTADGAAEYASRAEWEAAGMGMDG